MGGGAAPPAGQGDAETTEGLDHEHAGRPQHQERRHAVQPARDEPGDAAGQGAEGHVSGQAPEMVAKQQGAEPSGVFAHARGRHGLQAGGDEGQNEGAAHAGAVHEAASKTRSGQPQKQAFLAGDNGATVSEAGPGQSDKGRNLAHAQGSKPGAPWERKGEAQASAPTGSGGVHHAKRSANGTTSPTTKRAGGTTPRRSRSATA